MKLYFKPIAFLAAVALFMVCAPVALVFNISTIIKYKQNLFVILGRLFWEIFKIVLDFLLIIAVYIDRLGNIILGPLFIAILSKKTPRGKCRDMKKEIIIIDTDKDKHVITDNAPFNTFGLNNWTISASIGRLQEYNRLNAFGVKFAALLDRVFGPAHCKRSFEFHLIKTAFFKSTAGIS
jgi:hypothetical protein